MFRALRRTNLPPEYIFAVTVGAATKMTLATWHLLEPADVINSLAALVGTLESDPDVPPASQTNGDTKENGAKEENN